MPSDLIAATIQTTAAFERLLAAIAEFEQKKLVAARYRLLRALISS